MYLKEGHGRNLHDRGFIHLLREANMPALRHFEESLRIWWPLRWHRLGGRIGSDSRNKRHLFVIWTYSDDHGKSEDIFWRKTSLMSYRRWTTAYIGWNLLLRDVFRRFDQTCRKHYHGLTMAPLKQPKAPSRMFPSIF